MATAIGSIMANELVIEFEDYTLETAKVAIPLDGATTDADITAIVDGFAALSGALILSAKVVRSFPVTGFAVSGKPSSSAPGLVAAILAMDFSKTNPVNALKTVSKQVLLPSYIASILNNSSKPYRPVTGNSTYNTLIGLLEADLDFVGSDGNHYPGGWSYNNANSKFGTKLSVTDGE